MSRNNPYSNNTALGMYGVSNNTSQSNPAKHVREIGDKHSGNIEAEIL